MRLPLAAAVCLLAVTLAPLAHARQDAAASYRIRPHDILEITVEGRASDSGPTEVDARGKVDVAFVGGVDAAGKTTDELAAELTERFGKFLKEPRVGVRVVGARRARCRVG